MLVEIYSDIVCPWCYIGERRFDTALARFESQVDVRFRPFQLDPNAPENPIPLKRYLASRFGPGAERMTQHVGLVAGAEGLEIDWDRALAVNTRNAHRLLGLAEREYGTAVQRALARELFALHFARGADVADHDTLAKAAAQVGMDHDRALVYLASGEGERELEAELDRAHRLGIRAVPTFVIDGQPAVQGAQSPELFLEVLRQAATAE